MIPIISARIEITKVGSETPDMEIPGNHIANVELTEKIGELIDNGNITLNNDNNQYTDTFSSGDRLDFYVDYALDEYPEWGARQWGEKVWGGERHVWTAIVRSHSRSYSGNNISKIDIKCEDFVFSVLNMRNIFKSFQDVKITSAIDEIVSDSAKELEVYYDRELEQTVNVSYDGQSAFDALRDLLDRGNLTARAQKNMLVISEYQSKEPRFTLTDEDTGYLSFEYEDEGVKNFVRVDGATANALDENAVQTSVDDMVNVTEDERQYFRTQTRKSQISLLELYTERVSEDNISIRLQADNNGPISLDHRTSDIEALTQDHRFISKDGWTTFDIPDHTLPDTRPWVIIEVDGEEGHRIGVDSNGVPAHKVYFPYEISTVDYDVDSIGNYRRRESYMEEKKAGNTAEAAEIANKTLQHYDKPEVTIEAECNSVRTHNLRPADIVKFNGKNWIVKKRDDSYDDIHMQSSLLLQEVSTV